MNLLARAAACLVVLGAGPTFAASPAYRVPNVAHGTGPASVTLSGQTFVNHGLVGVGRLSAATRDFQGDTLGSFSAMAVTAWSRRPDGTYAGKLLTLPDRGPNGVGTIKGTSDYANRLHAFDIAFRPYTEDKPTAPDQLTLKPTGGLLLKDDQGRSFTGMDPASGVVTRGGIAYPSPASGPGAGQVSLDSEGLARLADGGFWVSDEYAASLYRFDKAGALVATVPAVPALLPRVGGRIDFSGGAAPETGRRNNQGLEGLSVTPDQTRLVALLQSATVQDSAAGKDRDDGRAVTRLLVYDIAGAPAPAPAPARPVAEYALELPVFRNKGDGAAPDKTAAPSEILALDDHRFLMLARDGNGRGNGATRPAVYRSILLVDTTGATNLAGTDFETTTKALAPGGVLAQGVTPATLVELVNLVNPDQLARFGLNLDNAASTPFTLPEKLEALALVPALDPRAPNDAFLLIGSDNDFQTADGKVGEVSFDAGVKTTAGEPAGDNDNLVLVYRLTLPTGLAPR
jgi:hypothetical protein